MARYLLDTDAIVDFINRRPAAIALLGQLTEQETLCVCTVVLTEVYSGLGANQEARAQEILSASEYLPATETIARQAGFWRFAFARRGIQLSTTDVLVAATAAQYGATVVTRNTRDYPMPEVSVLALPG